jgi:hypothetical protein
VELKIPFSVVPSIINKKVKMRYSFIQSVVLLDVVMVIAVAPKNLIVGQDEIFAEKKIITKSGL